MIEVTNVSVVAIFNKGKVKPYMFKYENDRIKIFKIEREYKEKDASGEILCYRCLHEKGFSYILKFNVQEHKWYLYLDKPN